MSERLTREHVTISAGGGSSSASTPRSFHRLAAAIQVDPVAIHLAPDAEDLCRPPASDRLLELVDDLRHRLAFELGVVLPPVRVRVDPALVDGGYRVLVDGNTAGEGVVPPGTVMVIGADVDASGVRWAADPVFGLPVAWMPPEVVPDDADTAVVEREQLLVAHLGELAHRHAPALLTRDGLVDLVDAVRARSPRSVEELDHGLLPLAVLHSVLRALLAEGTSIRNLRGILDELGSCVATGASFDELVDTAQRAVGL